MTLPLAAMSCAILAFVISGQANAARWNPELGTTGDPAQVQPYLEKLKQENGIVDKATPRADVKIPVVEQPAKTQYPEGDPRRVQPYIEQVRIREGMGPSEAYQQQAAPPATAATSTVTGAASGSERVQPYIETLKKGYELEPRYPAVRHAAGFNIVASNRFDIKGEAAQANSFDAVYQPGSKYSLGFDVFYEYQFLRNRYLGAFGAIARLGVLSLSGNGFFKTGQVNSDTNFRFTAVPLSAGVGYRLTQARFIVPYAQLLGMAVPFIETRDDKKSDKRGYSRGVNAIGGVALNLDWISRSNAWQAYDSSGVVHTYFVVQAEYMRTLFGVVKFDYDALYAGFTFEF